MPHAIGQDVGDPYKIFVAAILKSGIEDAKRLVHERDRDWIHSKDCIMLCEWIGLDHGYFSDMALAEIEEYDLKQEEENSHIPPPR